MKIYKMLVFLLITSFTIVFVACDDNSVGNSKYPTLKVINEWTYDNGESGVGSFPIVSVSLVGYEFKSLNIVRGNSQTFALDKGMPSGYNNINVSVTCHSPPYVGVTKSNSFNFSNGKTTTVTITRSGLQ
jgi:hypothetical protein